MKKYLINFISFIFISLFFLGCSSNRTPAIPQFNSGMQKNKDWLSYNKYAQINNYPILDFAATTLKYRFGDYTIYNYDTFKIDDPEVVIETKWHNCNGKDLFEFKFYTPDGRLAHYDYFIPNTIYTKWTIGRSLLVKNTPIADFIGTWNVKIFVNGKFVINKKFNIKNTGKLEKENTKIKVAFAPYWNSRNSTWNHNKAASSFISQASLRDNPKLEIIPTNMVLKDMGNPQFDYERFKEQIQLELKDENGFLNSFIKKHPVDYLIVGRVKSAWSMGNTQDTNFETLIIDVKNKSIIHQINTQYSLSRTAFIGIRNKVKGIHPHRVKVYNKLYEDLKDIIRNLN